MAWIRTFFVEVLRKVFTFLTAMAIMLLTTVIVFSVSASIMVVPTYAGIWIAHWIGLPLPF